MFARRSEPRSVSATRREFLSHSSAAAAVAAPWLLHAVRGRAASGDHPLRIAAIGVGGSRGMCNQGGYIARCAAEHGRMIAVCDVDGRHAAEFNRDFDGQLAQYADYRELLAKEQPDVVTIGTPDHWHVAIAAAALRAGCHVYCEKPLTLTIDEGIFLREVVRATGKVLQVGTQQRSEYDRRFLKAVALVRSGRLGQRVNATVAIDSGETGGPFPTTAAPDDLEWNLWLGPAQEAEYCEARRRGFRSFYDYSGGNLTDWGVHHVDIAQWALGYERSGPVKAVGDALFTPLVPDGFEWRAYLAGEATLPNGFHAATRFHVDLEYASGAKLSVTDRVARYDGTRFDNGILFEGERGRVFVNRERLSGKPVEDLTTADERELDDRIVELCHGKPPAAKSGHMANFFACIHEGGEPASDVDTHHRTMTACHLANVALWLRREVRWDPASERFVDDPAAEALRTRPRRAGFELA